MAKVLLVGINARYSHPAVALYYLKTFAAHVPSDIQIAEYTIRNNPEEIAESICRQKPDAVGLSAYIWNSRIIAQLLEIISFKKNFFIFLGGPEVTYNPEEWLKKYPAIDYIITGHGEEGFCRVLQSSFTLNDNIIQSNNPPFDEIPFPYKEEDFPGFKNKNVYYESSRGCPYSCTYCISSRGDQKLEFRDCARVNDEIGIIMQHSPKLVKFIDRTFNANAERARQIWEMLIANYSGKRTTFHFEVHPALLSEKDFEVLNEVPDGLFQFEIGIQTAHRDVRVEIGRKGNWEKEKLAIEKLKTMNNIHLHVDLIAGLPGERFDMLGESFDSVYALGADHFQLGILKLLPGTDMRRKAEKYQMQYDKCPPYAIIRNKWLSEEEVRRIKIIARLVDALNNSKSYVVTMKELCARFSSPWELYCAFAKKAKEDLRDISWYAMCCFLRDYVCMSFPDEIEFFKDCLAFDWFSKFNGHRMPSILKGEKYYHKKNKVREMIMKRRSENYSEIVNFQNVKIFIPESDEFKRKYLNDGEAIVYLSDSTQKILFKEI